jgi:two-component system CheB/CheR fusion protein
MRVAVGEAQQARSDAEQANRAKDQFLAVLSHELRTPLTSIFLHAQLLHTREMDLGKIKRAGESIERSAKIQLQLIEDLLDVSRIVGGKFHIEFKPVDLRATVLAAIEDVSGSATRKSVQLKVDVDQSTIMVSGDPVRLQQVVSNLLVNAIKFTPEKGTVTVVLEIAEGDARLEVSDTGMGIDANFLPHVFNRFAQADTSRTRAYGGLGLGLAIVRHLLDLHHGTVGAESAGLGMGATFWFTLPLVSVARSTRPPCAERTVDALQPTDGASRTEEYGELRDVGILVVDDDSGVREAVAEALHRTGARVRVAESAAQAMAVVDEFRPEVLLCDIAMPGEDGYSFLRRLRARGTARGGDIPALALTALAGENDRDLALAAGYQMHLSKPIDVASLTLAVLELVTSAARPQTNSL